MHVESLHSLHIQMMRFEHGNVKMIIWHICTNLLLDVWQILRKSSIMIVLVNCSYIWEPLLFYWLKPSLCEGQHIHWLHAHRDCSNNGWVMMNIEWRPSILGYQVISKYCIDKNIRALVSLHSSRNRFCTIKAMFMDGHGKSGNLFPLTSSSWIQHNLTFLCDGANTTIGTLFSYNNFISHHSYNLDFLELAQQGISRR